MESSSHIGIEHKKEIFFTRFCDFRLNEKVDVCGIVKNFFYGKKKDFYLRCDLFDNINEPNQMIGFYVSNIRFENLPKVRYIGDIVVASNVYLYSRQNELQISTSYNSDVHVISYLETEFVGEDEESNPLWRVSTKNSSDVDDVLRLASRSSVEQEYIAQMRMNSMKYFSKVPRCNGKYMSSFEEARILKNRELYKRDYIGKVIKLNVRKNVNLRWKFLLWDGTSPPNKKKVQLDSEDFDFPLPRKFNNQTNLYEDDEEESIARGCIDVCLKPDTSTEASLRFIEHFVREGDWVFIRNILFQSVEGYLVMENQFSKISILPPHDYRIYQKNKEKKIGYLSIRSFIPSNTNVYKDRIIPVIALPREMEDVFIINKQEDQEDLFVVTQGCIDEFRSWNFLSEKTDSFVRPLCVECGYLLEKIPSTDNYKCITGCDGKIVSSKIRISSSQQSMIDEDEEEEEEEEGENSNTKFPIVWDYKFQFKISDPEFPGSESLCVCVANKSGEEFFGFPPCDLTRNPEALGKMEKKVQMLKDSNQRFRMCLRVSELDGVSDNGIIYYLERTKIFCENDEESL